MIVDHAIKVSTHDAELERVCMRNRLRALIPVLKRMFEDFDVSRTGEICLADFDRARTMSLPPEITKVLKSHKLEEFFHLLDADASGYINQREWVDGMCCLILNEVPIENLQMLHLLYRQASDMDALKAALLPAGPATSRDPANFDYP